MVGFLRSVAAAVIDLLEAFAGVLEAATKFVSDLLAALRDLVERETE